MRKSFLTAVKLAIDEKLTFIGDTEKKATFDVFMNILLASKLIKKSQIQELISVYIVDILNSWGNGVVSFPTWEGPGYYVYEVSYTTGKDQLENKICRYDKYLSYLIDRLNLCISHSITAVGSTLNYRIPYNSNSNLNISTGRTGGTSWVDETQIGVTPASNISLFSRQQSQTADVDFYMGVGFGEISYLNTRSMATGVIVSSAEIKNYSNDCLIYCAGSAGKMSLFYQTFYIYYSTHFTVDMQGVNVDSTQTDDDWDINGIPLLANESMLIYTNTEDAEVRKPIDPQTTQDTWGEPGTGIHYTAGLTGGFFDNRSCYATVTNFAFGA